MILNVLDIIGSVLMCTSFIIMGSQGLRYSKYGEEVYRQRVGYLFSTCMLLSGISRGVYLFNPSDDPIFFDVLLKISTGLVGWFCVYYMPIAISELKRLKRVTEIQRDVIEHREGLEKLTEITKQINVRNNRP